MLFVYQEAIRHISEDIQVLNLLMVLEKDYFPLYYLPHILENEWDDVHPKYCHCEKNITIAYHNVMVKEHYQLLQLIW